jgi:Ca-activated chloride channel homolog
MARKTPRPLVAGLLATAVGVLAIGAAYTFLPHGSNPKSVPAPPCDSSCFRLTVAVTIDKGSLIEKMAKDYTAARHVFGGRRVQIDVYREYSGDTMNRLIGGNYPVRQGFPLPHVWIPATSAWVEMLKQGSGFRPIKDPTKITQTPLVIAMPKTMAQVLGWPNKQIDWSTIKDLIDHGWASKGKPEWGPFKLGKTNPTLSTSGLHATIAMFQEKAGRDGPLRSEDVTANQDARAFVQQLEASVVHYGETTMTFFLHVREEQDAAGEGPFTYISAIASEEKGVYDYNIGNTADDPSRRQPPPAADKQIVALYPTPTPISDSPYVQLSTMGDKRDLQQAADDFLRYLLKPAQQDAFKEGGLRGADGSFDPKVISQEHGLLPQRPQALPIPDGQVLNQVLTAWNQLRKPARVLLVLDTSGSMSEAPDQLVAVSHAVDDPNSCGIPQSPQPAPSWSNEGTSGKIKLDLVKDAAKYAIAQFGPQDEVGLWSLHRTANQAYNTLVWPPLRIGEPLAIDRLKDAIDKLTPSGATPLFHTAVDAQHGVGQDAEPTKINAVVLLSDGRNDLGQGVSDGYPCQQTMNRLAAEYKNSSVRIFTIAYGADADITTLHEIATKTKGAYYNATNPASIDLVMRNVISNF